MFNQEYRQAERDSPSTISDSLYDNFIKDLQCKMDIQNLN